MTTYDRNAFSRPSAFLLSGLVSCLVSTGCSSAPIGDEDTRFTSNALRSDYRVSASVTVDASQNSLTAVLTNASTSDRDAAGPVPAAVSCKSITFLTRVAPVSDCGGASFDGKPVVLHDVSFAPAESKTMATLGGGELEELRAATGLDLAYCTASAALDCGFTCMHNGEPHSYGTEWGHATVNGTGETWFSCAQDGEVKTDGYCAVVNGVKKVSGATWDSDGEPGTNTYKTNYCRDRGVIESVAVCVANYDRDPNNGQCKPRSCGAIPHGGAVVEAIQGGTRTWTCEFGTPVRPVVACPAPWNLGANECTPPRPCDEGPHGTIWYESECGGSRGEYLQTYRCDNGSPTILSGRFTGMECGNDDGEPR